MKVVAIDPGESIGLIVEGENETVGRTITGQYVDRLKELFTTLCTVQPDIVVYEQFALRQSAAAKLVGNKFITCEVIGVIKLYCELYKVRIIALLPMNKEYCGFSSNPKDAHYLKINMNAQKITEHVRDAYRLLCYAKMFEVNK